MPAMMIHNIEWETRDVDEKLAQLLPRNIIALDVHPAHQQGYVGQMKIHLAHRMHHDFGVRPASFLWDWYQYDRHYTFEGGGYTPDKLAIMP